MICVPCGAHALDKSAPRRNSHAKISPAYDDTSKVWTYVGTTSKGTTYGCFPACPRRGLGQMVKVLVHQELHLNNAKKSVEA